jgi:hypothetical protein
MTETEEVGVVEHIRRELGRKIDLAIKEMLPRSAFYRPMPSEPSYMVRRHATGVQFLSLPCEACVTMLLHPKDEYYLINPPLAGITEM